MTGIWSSEQNKKFPIRCVLFATCLQPKSMLKQNKGIDFPVVGYFFLPVPMDVHNNNYAL